VTAVRAQCFAVFSLLLLLLGPFSCSSDDAPSPEHEGRGPDAGEPDAGSVLEPGEALPGGDTTNTLAGGSNAFLERLANLSEEHQRSFFTGNSFFNQTWVQAPSSTEARDGLGPTFNARSCSGCHFKDGRGEPPDDDPTALGLLLRISVPGRDEHGEPLGDPTYGGQLQNLALPDVPAEGTLVIDHEQIEGEYGDGERYSLRKPIYRIENPAFGPLPDELMMSPRVAPAMIGLGLLEAIPQARLEALADPDDADGDGISGRLNHVWDVESSSVTIGRFGWKDEQPSVLQQSAGAFNGDMGITSRLFPQQNCTGAQSACEAAISGGDPEISDELLAKVGLYARSLAVPARRHPGDADVLAGKALFRRIGCDGCHVPSHETGAAAFDELSGQTIWPYTDLLLHDMGDELSDQRPSFEAEGNEWRTAPLWGIGMIHAVNGHERLLHDGRARGVGEAVLWHGGEAQASADAFRQLNQDERAQLIRFVESL
jgi:CxxC motif-containing protein (DUF1111 family)